MMAMQPASQPVDQYVGCVRPPKGGALAVAWRGLLQIDHGVPEPHQCPLALQVALHLHQLVVLGGPRGRTDIHLTYTHHIHLFHIQEF